MKIIFITYINRSGSTFLLQQLSKLPSVLVCPEADSLANELLLDPLAVKPVAARKKLIKTLYKDDKFKHWGISEKEIQEMNFSGNCMDLFCDILIRYGIHHKPDANFYVFKAERLFSFLPRYNNEILAHYNLSIVSLVRDIRAVYHSQKNLILPHKNRKMSNNPVATALYWNTYINTIIKHFNSIKYNMLYENLIRNFNIEFDSLMKTLEINYKDFTIHEGDLFKRLQENQKSIHPNVLKGPLKERVNAWEKSLTRTEVAILEMISGKYLKRMDYKLLNPGIFFPYIYIKIGFYTLGFIIPLWIIKGMHKFGIYKK